MVPTGNQRITGQFHERADSMGSLRRFSSSLGCRRAVVDEPETETYVIPGPYFLYPEAVIPAQKQG